MKISNSRERLKEMMEILNLKQVDIVNKTGINKSALSNYLHGTREPRQDQLSLIADPYNINPAWLMGYDVDMYYPKSTTPLIKEIDKELEKLDTAALEIVYELVCKLKK